MFFLLHSLQWALLRVDSDKKDKSVFFISSFLHSSIWTGIFSVYAPPPPILVGAYYLHPPNARAIFLHNDLLCNGMCSVTGGT